MTGKPGISIKCRVAAAAVSVTAAALLLAVLWLRGAFLPLWALWSDASFELTLSDGSRAECSLTHRRFRAAAYGDVLMETKRSWFVQTAFAADIDGDDTEELVLLVWKRGSFGSHRPTWVERDEIGFSQHIFIYDSDKGSFGRGDGGIAVTGDPQDDGRIRPIWMSSKLGLRAAQIRPGGVISGTGRTSVEVVDPDGAVSRWGWMSWGLRRVD